MLAGHMRPAGGGFKTTDFKCPKCVYELQIIMTIIKNVKSNPIIFDQHSDLPRCRSWERKKWPQVKEKKRNETYKSQLRKGKRRYRNEIRKLSPEKQDRIPSYITHSFFCSVIF